MKSSRSLRLKKAEKEIRALGETRGVLTVRIYTINRALIKFLDLESGRLFEAGRLLNFQHFQQV